MQVLFDHQVFSYQETGGVSRYFSELYGRLPAFGWKTEAGFRYTVNRYLLERQATNDFLPFFGNARFKGKTRLLAAWNKTRSIASLGKKAWDVFHPTYYDPYFLPKLSGRPFVLTIHDMIHELFPDAVSDASVVQKNKRCLAGKASLVIAVSEQTKKDVVNILQIDPRKVVVIHHGNALSPDLVVPSRVDIPENYLLYVGGRSTYKNVAVLWQAFATLRKKNPSLWLVHVGGGALQTEEKAQLAKLGVLDYVVQRSVGDQGLAALYQKARCLAYTSLYEGFGLPLVEAMAYGCPVVAANASCLPEIGGAFADYADPSDPESWVRLLEPWLEPEKRVDTIGIAKRQDWATHYSWDRCANATANAYQTVL